MTARMSAIACFTFDNMGEVAEAGAAARPTAGAPHPSIAVGYPNLFALLERRALAATFFVEGWNGEHHRDTVAEIVRRGHELGMHGWAHERWDELGDEEEERLARRATEALADAAGVAPRGFRAPGGRRRPRTEDVLLHLGYAYDASLGDGMRPARLPSGLAQVPFVWPGVDGFHYLRDAPAAPAQVRDAWLRTLAKAADEGGLFLLICHAFLTGVERERLAALEDVIAAAQADPRVEVKTAGELAASIAPRAGG